jgi:hypothetical protein
MKHNIPQEVLDRTALALVENDATRALATLSRADHDAALMLATTLGNIAHTLRLGLMPTVHQSIALNDRGRARRGKRAPAKGAEPSNVIDMHAWLVQRVGAQQ